MCVYNDKYIQIIQNIYTIHDKTNTVLFFPCKQQMVRETYDFSASRLQISDQKNLWIKNPWCICWEVSLTVPPDSVTLRILTHPCYRRSNSPFQLTNSTTISPSPCLLPNLPIVQPNFLLNTQYFDLLVPWLAKSEKYSPSGVFSIQNCHGRIVSKSPTQQIQAFGEIPQNYHTFAVCLSPKLSWFNDSCPTGGYP